MRDTTQAPPPPPATINHRFFTTTPLLDPAIYAACFASARRNLPTPQADAAGVWIDHAALEEWVRGGPVAGDGEEVGR